MHFIESLNKACNYPIQIKRNFNLVNSSFSVNVLFGSELLVTAFLTLWNLIRISSKVIHQINKVLLKPTMFENVEINI